MFGSKQRYLRVGAVAGADGSALTGNSETRINPPRRMQESRSIFTSATIELVAPGDDSDPTVVFFPVLQDGELIDGHSSRVTMAAANANGGRICIGVILAGKKASDSDLLTADTAIADTEWANGSAHTAIVCRSSRFTAPTHFNTGEACRAAGIAH